MIDPQHEDSFHLTPLDVRKQEFRKSLRGYETLGVEDFRMRVADALERVIRERSVLEERLAALTDQLRAETRATADREAQVIVREAEAEARRRLEEARSVEHEARERLADVQREFQSYLAGFRALLERQLAELRALEGTRG